jgi:Ca2+/H+ antiporter
MIVLLIYVMPIVISIPLVVEHGLDMHGETIGLFIPLVNIVFMFDVVSRAVDELAMATRKDDLSAN